MPAMTYYRDRGQGPPAQSAAAVQLPRSRVRFGRTLYRDTDREIVERALEVAGKRGVPATEVALAWMLRNPAVTSPIVGVTKPEQLTQAIAAVDVELDDEEVAFLEEPYLPHSETGFR
jgi:1-deoxyxylulose-5-phosphate synthase